ncbi:translation initiation factor IF-2 [Candidatus Poribacteria bacterium]|nr:translation initiation factor IF-2 [Candidatus Poribacteria bacterium]MYH81717.1 translation initiation factor IF-2 [Candidatus Poribacteria bacterium]MYK92891.1 translation initiation factor IF-2 [Candidatus Poribacteria bacterium]
MNKEPRQRRRAPKGNREEKQDQGTPVYELAKQYDLTTKQLITLLEEHGVRVKSDRSPLDADTVALIESEIVESEEVVSTPEVSTEDITEGASNTANGLQVEEGATVADLATTLELQPSALIMQLMKLKVMANINQRLDYETLVMLGEHLNFQAVKLPTLEEELLVETPDPPESLQPRAPVVTIMGHVDHGKTSLLDSIRQSNISESEAGNITQHIGAYHVTLEGGSVVFLDTPGHAAFTAMRARGAQVTDIVVLIVAADDGVMPQTVEAINHAKAAKVPIVVAINKIDVPGARPDYIKQQLTEHELVPEDWGGQTICVETSAVEGTGIDFLLEMLLLEAALLELKANPNKSARGVVIEAQVDKGRGAVATVLVQSGTLRVGDVFISGRYSGRVRAMMDDLGKRLKEAGPSVPVEVLGFTGVPEAGDRFYAIESDKDARTISETRQDQYRTQKLGANSHVSLENLFQQIQEGEIKELNVVLKGDVQGSVQAVASSLLELSTEEVKINIIHQAVGGITETDILLASASDAIVVGFNVHPTTEAVQAKETEGIDVRTYNVIYELISYIRSAMEGLLDPEVREIVIGRAEVRELFKVPRLGLVAGSYVNWGRISYNQPLRILRDNRLIHEGKVNSLRRFKDNVNEVQANYECGIGIETFDDLQVGDVLECYVHEQVARSLS